MSDLDDRHTAPARPTSVDDLESLVGTELGPTAWQEVTQQRIDDFAAVTDDHQWIHVDPERAATTDLGGTIAHGLLTLSLGPGMLYSLLSFEGFAHSLNYGYEKVRFPAPLPAGASVRMRATITAVRPVDGGAQITCTLTYDRQGSDKPVCVAESVSRVRA